MYKIIHLPTGTYLQVKPYGTNTWIPWEFTDKHSAESILNCFRITVNYETELVCYLGDNQYTYTSVIVPAEHLELVET